MALTPSDGQHDPVAVAVVEQRVGLVVERVRVAEHPAGVRVAALEQRVVGPDHPHFAVGGAGEHVAAAGGHAAGGDADALALVALPVAVGVGQHGGRVGLGHHDVGVGVEPGGATETSRGLVSWVRSKNSVTVARSTSSSPTAAGRRGRRRPAAAW